MQGQKSRSEQLGPMEFFILATVEKAGLRSLYAFREQAELEPGGMRSALIRLESKRLILRGEPGERRRRDMTLTPEGHEFLDRHWDQCLRDYPDMESVLRAATVAWLMADAAAAAMYLRNVGESRRTT